MDIPQVSIKIRYQGVLEHFQFDVGTSYEDVISMAIYRFEIPSELQKALIITNLDGYIFDKQLFEYFILLFPQPQLVFYLRHKWMQLRQGQPGTRLFRKIHNDNNQINCSSISSSRSSNINQAIQQTEEPRRDQQHQHEEPTYSAAPVRRQNCFLGTIPKHRARLDGEEKAEITKRLRMLSAMQKQRRAKRDQDKRNASTFKNAIRL